MKWRVVMLRKLAVFIISAGLTMSPLSVQALGFGGIKLKSSLNEKLNAEELKIPIRYIGVGEKLEDLRVFNPKEYVNALFAE